MDRLVSHVLRDCLVILATKAGDFLIVDAPRRSDAILVLAGETDRVRRRALELLSQGYGKRVVLDVPKNARCTSLRRSSWRRRYIQDLPQAGAGQHLSDRRAVDQRGIEGSGKMFAAREGQRAC